MNRILKKRELTPEIAWFEVEAPRIAKHWKPGQFIIIRPEKDSERIPLTLVAGDTARGSIVMVIQAMQDGRNAAKAIHLALSEKREREAGKSPDETLALEGKR